MLYFPKQVIAIGSVIVGSRLGLDASGVLTGLYGVVFDFDDLVDWPDGTVNTPSHQIIVEIQASVPNVAGNANGKLLPVNATAQYSSSPLIQQLGSLNTVVVREPVLTFQTHTSNVTSVV